MPSQPPGTRLRARVMAELADVCLDIRKLRKKLRQIESLERQDRGLTEEEEVKVSRKDEIRANLQRLVVQQQQLKDNLKEMASTQRSSSEYVDTRQTEITDDDGTAGENRTSLIEEKESETSNTESSVPQGASERDSEELSHTVTNLETSVPQGVSEQDSTNTQQEDARESTETTGPNRGLGTVVAVSRRDEAASTRMQRASLSAAKLQRSMFTVRTLKGHNDLICALDCHGSVLVSGSRDTMLKLWDADSGRELRSMGGHTGTVTSVVLVPSQELGGASGSVGSRIEQCLAITGSNDCSIKIWSLGDGQLKRSIYTYSPVATVDHSSRLIASGSEGGKVELWDLETGESVRSVQGHEDAVTTVKLRGNRLVSGCAGGVVKVWDIRDQSLQPVISSDKATNLAEVPVKQRRIRCLATTDDSVYWGDDGVNVKVLDAKSGKLRKLRNHVTEFGSSSAMTTTCSFLVCAGYDIDRGNGYLNVRSLPQEEYLATLDDDNTGYVTCLSCAEATRDGVTFHRWCTGGAELKIWDQLPTCKMKKRARPESDDNCVTSAKQIRRYSSPDPIDTESSEGESDYDPTNDDSDDDDDANSTENAKRSWCTIS